MQAEHQLSEDRSTWPVEKNIQSQANLGGTKELERKTGVLVGPELPWAGGGTEGGGPVPTWGNCLSQSSNTEGWEGNGWSMAA